MTIALASRRPEVDPPSGARSTVPVGRDRLRTPDPSLVVGVAVLTGLAVWRIVVAASVDGPVTTDAGNWLAYGHDLLGRDVRSSSIAYPPLVPLLTVGITNVLGLDRGLAVLVGVCSIGPAAGTLWTLRKFDLRWSATWAGAVVAGAASSADAAAWGGFPQLIGLGLIGPLLWLLDDHLRVPSRRRAVTTSLVAFLLVASSHFIAAVALVACVVVVLLHWGGRPTGTGLRALVRTLTGLWPLAGVLLLVPWYLPIAAVGSAVAGPSSVALALEGIRHVSRDVHWFWFCAAAVAVLTPIVLLDRRNERSWVVASSMSVATVIGFVLLADPRAAYLVPVAGALGFGLLASSPARYSPPARAALKLSSVAVVSVVAVAQFSTATAFRERVEHHAIAGGGVGDAIEWLRIVPDDVIVAVAPVRSAPLGWWVEGVSRRRTVTAGEIRWLHYPDEQRRARSAASILGHRFPTRGQIDIAEEIGVDLILVPASWPGLDRAAMLRELRAGSVETCRADADVVVLSVVSQDGGPNPCR